MADADANNTYRRHPQLVDTLPKAVRKQRRLAADLAPLETLLEKEKVARKDIDALLAAAGYTKRGEGVTCLGYNVVHRERDGNISYDVGLLAPILIERLVALGMPREDNGPKDAEDYQAGAVSFVLDAIAQVRSQGDTAKWAEVKPMKGAKVRQARAA